MTSPELSVFITSYNSELYIREAINSILNQTYTDYELIIIDNASTDKTVSIIKSYMDNRIHLVSHSQNIGIVGSRNQALDMAKGTFITFLDSDDIAHPQKFEKQLAFLKNNPEFGMVGSSVILINGKGTETGRWKLNSRAGTIPAIMLFHNYFVNSAVMFRKALVKDFKYPEDLIIGEDYILWFNLLQISKGINLPEYLTSYRQHSHSLIQCNAEKKEAYDKKVYKHIFQKIGLQPTDEEYEIHISLKNDVPVNSMMQMRKTFAWLHKILKYSQNSSFIDKKKSPRVSMNRWLKVCYKSRNKPGLLIYGVYKILFNIKFFIN